MEKSLIGILNAEDRLVRKIASSEEAILHFQNKHDIISAIPIECDCKTADLAECDDLISHYQQELEKYERQLGSVRESLRQYLITLFK